MQIRFADRRPTGDYALVIPAAGANRPGLGERSAALDGALKAQRFDGEAGSTAEHYLDGDNGRRLLVIGLGALGKAGDQRQAADFG